MTRPFLTARGVVAAAFMIATLDVGCRCGGSTEGHASQGAAADGKRKPLPKSRAIGRGASLSATPTFPTEDTEVGAMPPGDAPVQPAVSMSGQRLAWVDPKGQPIIDGVARSGFDRARDPMFSRSGQYVAYVGRIGDPKDGGETEEYVVVGDVRLGPYERITLLHVFDDGRVQFLAGPPNKRAVYVDDTPGDTYDKIDRIDLVRAEEDGPVTVYRASEADEQCIVHGKDVTCHAKVGRPELGEDGTVAYVAGDGRDEFYVVIGGKRLEQTYPFVDWRVVLGPQGRYAFVVSDDGTNRRVNVGGTLGEPYERIAQLTMSADGSTVAYAARKDIDDFLVVGDAAQPPVDGELKEILLGPEGEHWATLVRADDGAFVVTETGTHDKHRSVSWLTHSADATHLAYVARTGDPTKPNEQTEHLVLDGALGEGFEEVGDPRFYSDGSVGYVARTGDEYWFIRGETRLGPYGDIGMPRAIAGIAELNYTTTEDGHYAFAARKGKDWHAVVDGTEGPAYAGVWGQPFHFEDGKAGYLARSGDALWWRVAEPGTP